MPDGVTITLTHAEALVLFELLSSYYEGERGTGDILLPDPAESYAMLKLWGYLEKLLVEPSMANYGTLVDDAKAILVELRGGTTDCLVDDTEELSWATLVSLKLLERVQPMSKLRKVNKQQSSTD